MEIKDKILSKSDLIHDLDTHELSKANALDALGRIMNAVPSKDVPAKEIKEVALEVLNFHTKISQKQAEGDGSDGDTKLLPVPQ